MTPPPVNPYTCDPCLGDPRCEDAYLEDALMYKRWLMRTMCAIKALIGGGGPAGYATEGTLQALDAKITTCNTNNVTITTLPTVTINTAGLSTSANQATEITKLTSIDGKVTSCNTSAIAGTVGVSSLPATATLAESGSATISGDNIIHTPALGKKIRLYYLSLSALSANTDAVTAIVKFAAGGATLYEISLKAGAIWARNIGAGRRFVDGGVNDDLIVNLSDNQTVYVSFEYEEV